MLFIDIFVEVSFFLVLILTLCLVWNIQNHFCKQYICLVRANFIW